MDSHRKLWNANHQKLNRLLAQSDRDAAIALFLDQHAMVHAAKASGSQLFSFEDELLDGLTEAEIAQSPTAVSTPSPGSCSTWRASKISS